MSTPSGLFNPIHRTKRLNRHEVSFRAFAAYLVVEKDIENIKKGAGVPRDVPSQFPLPPGTIPERDPEALPRVDLPIGIIGAGVSGLYAAMMLEDLGLDYEILESSDRIGGRLYTHRFNGQQGFDAPVNTPARYDYFDVGAMRYPRIPFMDRVFDLFTRVDIDPLLIEYKLSADNNLKYYNTRPPLNPSATPTDNADDYFHVSLKNTGTVPFEYVEKGVDHWTGAVYDYYKDLFGKLDDVPPAERQKAFAEAWNELTSQDHHSTRGYMLSGKEGKPDGAPAPYPPSTIEWLETNDSATGLYDDAFVESVIDSLDFDWPNPIRGASASKKKVNPPKTPSQKKEAKEIDEEWEWVCVDGGSDHISHNMAGKLKKTAQLGKRVTHLSLDNQANAIVVGFADTKDVRTYSQVICTAPLGALAAIDTDGLELLYGQKQAIRALKYDASTKVGLKFEKRWWEDPTVMGGATIKGGQSSTDLPIRTCVYPSYGLNTTGAPGILLASYTWAQDAHRLGGLAQGKGTESEAQLLEITLNNVSKLHNVPTSKMGPVLDHYAHSWYNDSNTRGAFALFGPAQFGTPTAVIPSLFTSVKAPGANGKFHIAGEATSAHHAWVLGSLNSAWRAVYNALEGRPAKQALLIARWGIPDEESEVHLKSLTQLARYGRL